MPFSDADNRDRFLQILDTQAVVDFKICERPAILNATIHPDSGDEAQLREMVNTLKKWANLAA